MCPSAADCRRPGTSGRGTMERARRLAGQDNQVSQAASHIAHRGDDRLAIRPTWFVFFSIVVLCCWLEVLVENTLAPARSDSHRDSLVMSLLGTWHTTQDARRMVSPAALGGCVASGWFMSCCVFVGVVSCWFVSHFLCYVFCSDIVIHVHFSTSCLLFYYLN